MSVESNSPDYDRFTDSDEPNPWELADWILRTDNHLTRKLGWVFGTLFVAGSIAFGHFCANGFDILVYLGSIILSVGVIFYQAELTAIPFRKRIQAPILQLYEEEGIQTTAHVVKAKAKGRGKNKFQKVVLVYRVEPNSPTLYTKKAYDLQDKQEKQQQQQDDNQNDEFLIRVIPKIPTSAISKQKYDDVSDPWSDSNVFRFGLSLLAPIFWCMAVRYTFTTDVYEESFWIQGGLFWLFCLSLVGSMCWAYAWTLEETKSWLDGGAGPIEEKQEEIPEALATNGKPSMAEELNYEMV